MKDEERDIAENALLSALHDDLVAASRTIDNRLFFFIGAALIFAFLSKYVPLATWMVYTVALLSFVSILFMSDIKQSSRSHG